MANTPGGSFIPKRSTGKVTPVRSGRRIYIFTYIAYVVFFGTLLSVVGLFFLNQQAENQLNEYVVRLEQAQSSVNREQINSIRKLDQRIKIAEQVLNWHAAPSRLFGELESVIVQTVQLTSFSYERETGAGAELAFGGLTESFDVLLFQRDALENSAMLSAADIVDVSYGAIQGEIIEGNNRGAAVAAPTLPGEATVTFRFEDDAILSSIGYIPQAGGTTANNAVNLINSNDTTDAEDNVTDQ